MIQKLLVFLVLPGALLAAVPARAQPTVRNSFASDEAAARHRAAFAVAVRKAGFRIPPDMYYKYRIDVTRAESLRRAGLDLHELERRLPIDGPGSAVASSLYADLVVRGTVLSLVTDSSRRVFYHSRYRVRVAETWQGPPTDTVTVWLWSGPVGTSYAKVAESPTLRVGEEAVLHLSPIDFAQHAEAEKLGLAMGTNNATPGDFGLLRAVPVRGDQVLSDRDQRPTGPLADLRRQLRRIAAILDKEHFYQRVF